MYRESYQLPESHLPHGWSLAGNKLSGSNQESPHGKLTGYDNLLYMPAQGRASILQFVIHAGTRACLYFPLEDGAPGCNSIKQSTLVVMGNFGKDDRQVAAYAFLKNFPDFYRHQI